MSLPEGFEAGLPELEAVLGHAFADRGLLIEALTHSSFANEHEVPSNERLEFLGDAILDACASLMLIEAFPTHPEGALHQLRSKLVRDTTLAAIGRELGLGGHLLLGVGEEAGGGRDKGKLLEDATEAVVGAIFRDAGFARCCEVTAAWLGERLAALDPGDAEATALKDPVSRLQEITQKRQGVRPDYRDLGSWGPDHERTFEVAVFLDDEELGRGQGRTKQKARHQAAARALQQLADEGAN